MKKRERETERQREGEMERKREGKRENKKYIFLAPKSLNFKDLMKLAFRSKCHSNEVSDSKGFPGRHIKYVAWYAKEDWQVLTGVLQKHLLCLLTTHGILTFILGSITGLHILNLMVGLRLGL